MALNLMIGGAGSGKTRELLRHMISRSLEERERRFFVIVPEQFTMETQRELLRLHPTGAILNLEVTSLNRLAMRVFAETGNGGLEPLEEIGKTFLIEKIILEKTKELKYFTIKPGRPENAAQMKALISELIIYDSSPEALMEKDMGEGSLARKMADVKLIYSEFMRRLEGRYMTAEETPDRLIRVIGSSGILRGSVTAFDSFTGFTPVQLRLIGELMPIASDIIVTVTMDPDQDPFEKCRESDLFAMGSETARSLAGYAAEKGIRVEDITRIRAGSSGRHGESPSLAFLTDNLFRRGAGVWNEADSDITIGPAKDPRAEMELAARRILSLVRDEGYRYSDIAVIAGDQSQAGRYAGEIFRRAGIPCFLDEKRELTDNPYVEYIAAACDMCAEDFSYESVIRVLRTGMSPLSRSETDLLDNYILARGIRGRRRWQEPFVYLYEKQDEAELPVLNAIREKFIGIFIPFAENFAVRGSTVRDKSLALYELLRESLAEEKMLASASSFEEEGRSEAAAVYRQIVPYVMRIMDKLVEVLGSERISMSDYTALIKAGFAEGKVAVIPPGRDMVLIGDVERTRIPEVKALFFINANEGLVPKPQVSGGILTEEDRSKLEEAGISLRPSLRKALYIGRFYLYFVLSRASRRLFVSWSVRGAKGENMNPSYITGIISRMFPGSCADVEAGDLADMLTDRAAGLKVLARELSDVKADGTPPELLELFRYYRFDRELHPMAESLLEAAGKRYVKDEIGSAVAQALYGKVLRNSASRLEEYAVCAFRQFANYGLKLRPRVDGVFESRDMGTLIHSALELYGREIMKRGEEEPAPASHADIAGAAYEAAVADLGEGSLLYSTARDEYHIRRMRRLTLASVEALSRLLAAGDYEIFDVERRFSAEEVPGSFVMELPGGGRMELAGVIDRIDTAMSGDRVYVRIMDYKTGSTKFDPVRILNGLQLQLAIYMNATRELLRGKGLDPVPSGMFYFPVQDPILDYRPETDEELAERRALSMKPNGVVLDDPEVMRLMDRQLAPKIRSSVIPVKLNANGSADKRSSSVIGAEDMEALLRFALRKAERIGSSIALGDAEAAPYSYGTESGCSFCPYRAVCGFDERIPGMERRVIEKCTDEEAILRMREEEE